MVCIFSLQLVVYQVVCSQFTAVRLKSMLRSIYMRANRALWNLLQHGIFIDMSL